MSTHATSPCPRRPVGGFTLIEVVITMVVLAILAAIAIPSYNDSVRKSRRAEAFTAMAAVQQAQERWRGNHASYASSIDAAADDEETPGLGLSDTTPSGYYALELSSVSGTGYVLTASGVDGTTQAEDAQCRKLSLRLNDGNITYAGCGSCESFTYSGTHACWVR